jgi:hypothetical protein
MLTNDAPVSLPRSGTPLMVEGQLRMEREVASLNDAHCQKRFQAFLGQRTDPLDQKIANKHSANIVTLQQRYAMQISSPDAPPFVQPPAIFDRQKTIGLAYRNRNHIDVFSATDFIDREGNCIEDEGFALEKNSPQRLDQLPAELRKSFPLAVKITDDGHHAPPSAPHVSRNLLMSFAGLGMTDLASTAQMATDSNRLISTALMQSEIAMQEQTMMENMRSLERHAAMATLGAGEHEFMHQSADPASVSNSDIARQAITGVWSTMMDSIR